MPITRSFGDLPSAVENENLNITIPLDQGAAGDAETVRNPIGRPRTRQQSRIEEQATAENNRVRRIVEESLTEFRDEVIHMISEGFRNITLTNPQPDLQNVRVEPPDTDHVHIDNHRRNESEPCRTHTAGEFDRNSERVLNIIRNWRIRFTGDTSEVTVNEFIYRVNTLTMANLRGGYDLLCEHAHFLFEGKALKWFWRFHRSSRVIDWESLCEALKKQYKDYNTDYDIKDEILRRKQRQHESFDEFYDAIMVLCDRLRTPLTDYELCETIQRNLRTEVRQELLHLEIDSVAQLRRAVRRHEKFVNDLAASTANKRSYQKAHLSEVDATDVQTDTEDNLTNDNTEVCLLVRSGRCWNCDKAGHTFIDCLEPRTIFCYGCGIKNTFKPKCPNCSQRGNVLKDVRSKKDEHPKPN